MKNVVIVVAIVFLNIFFFSYFLFIYFFLVMKIDKCIKFRLQELFRKK
jgi:hypothetical protein